MSGELPPEEDEVPEKFRNMPPGTRPCPRCGAELHEDADLCPQCGDWIVQGPVSPRRLSWWLVLGIVLCLGAMLLWILL